LTSGGTNFTNCGYNHSTRIWGVIYAVLLSYTQCSIHDYGSFRPNWFQRAINAQPL